MTVTAPRNDEVRRYILEQLRGETFGNEAAFRFAVALATMAFRAGWLRGWCARAGLPYPDGLRNDRAPRRE